MAAQEPAAEYIWHIRTRNGGGTQSVQAAYPIEGIATQSAVSTARQTPASPLVVLRDGSHKAVFLVPCDQLAEMHRGESVPRGTHAGAPTAVIQLPGGMRATPGQLRDLQDSINAALAQGCPKVDLMLPSLAASAPHSAHDFHEPR